MTTKNTTPTARLMAAQSEIQTIVKDKVNPHFKKNYADINTMLAEVKPALHKHGLLIIQPIENGNVITRIIDAESGAVLCESSLQLSGQGNCQQRGSEITYYRRYSLQSLMALEAEDDDANAASAPTPAVQNEDNKPWLNKDDERFIKAMVWVKGKGEEGLKTATMLLSKDFKVNKELRAALFAAANGNFEIENASA